MFIISVDLCVILWDLTTVGLGGTETSDNSNVLSSGVCYTLLLCTNYSHLKAWDINQ